MRRAAGHGTSGRTERPCHLCHSTRTTADLPPNGGWHQEAFRRPADNSNGQLDGATRNSPNKHMTQTARLLGRRRLLDYEAVYLAVVWDHGRESAQALGPPGAALQSIQDILGPVVYIVDRQKVGVHVESHANLETVSRLIAHARASTGVNGSCVNVAPPLKTPTGRVRWDPKRDSECSLGHRVVLTEGVFAPTNGLRVSCGRGAGRKRACLWSSGVPRLRQAAPDSCTRVLCGRPAALPPPTVIWCATPDTIPRASPARPWLARRLGKPASRLEQPGALNQRGGLEPCRHAGLGWRP